MARRNRKHYGMGSALGRHFHHRPLMRPWGLRGLQGNPGVVGKVLSKLPHSVQGLLSKSGGVKAAGALAGNVLASVLTGVGNKQVVARLGVDESTTAGQATKLAVNVLTDVVAGVAAYEALSRVPGARQAAELALYAGATRSLANAVSRQVLGLAQVSAQVAGLGDEDDAEMMSGLMELLLPENAGVNGLTLPDDAQVGDYGELVLPADSNIGELVLPEASSVGDVDGSIF